MPFALIAGASQGIGLAIAWGLAERGYELLLVGRRPAPLAEAVDAARRLATDATRNVLGNTATREARSTPIVGLAADVTEDDGRARIVAAVEAREMGLDVLVHSAGTIARADVEDASLEDFDRQYAANLRAPAALTQALLPSLRRARGQVVFINSSAGLAARANAAQYGATLHGLRAFADALRAEVNEAGIRVTSIYPGRTATPRQELIHSWEGKEYRPERLLQPHDVAAMVVAAIELPRTAEVTDITIRSMTKP